MKSVPKSGIFNHFASLQQQVQYQKTIRHWSNISDHHMQSKDCGKHKTDNRSQCWFDMQVEANSFDMVFSLIFRYGESIDDSIFGNSVSIFQYQCFDRQFKSYFDGNNHGILSNNSFHLFASLINRLFEVGQLLP